MTQLYVKRLYPDALLPVKATKFAACFDMHAYIDNPEKKLVVPPGQTKCISTGLAMRPNEDYCVKLFPRSGLALDYDVSLMNCVGIADVDYYKQYGVLIHNYSPIPFEIIHKERICQIKVERVEPTNIIEVNELPPLSSGSNRTGGFGSTGRRIKV